MRSASVFRAGKDQRAVEIGALQQSHEQIEFLLRRYRINRVGNGFGRRAADSDFHRFGIAQNPRGEPLDLRRKRGGEKQRLAIGGNFFNNPAHVGQKSHVEHAIDFIEHEDADVAKDATNLARADRAAVPAWRQTISVPRASFFALFPVTNSAMNDRDAQISKAPIIAKCRFDLRGELARRLEDKTAEIAPCWRGA